MSENIGQTKFNELALEVSRQEKGEKQVNEIVKITIEKIMFLTVGEFLEIKNFFKTPKPEEETVETVTPDAGGVSVETSEEVKSDTLDDKTVEEPKEEKESPLLD